MQLFHTTTLERAERIEKTGFEDHGYKNETPCTWWSTSIHGHPSDPAVFSVEIPDEHLGPWLDPDGSVEGQYQDFRIPAEVVNNRYPWKREPERAVRSPD